MVFTAAHAIMYGQAWSLPIQINTGAMMQHRFIPALAFNILTPIYDLINDFLGFGRPFMRRVVEMSAIGDGEKVLDVGCGTGSLLSELPGRKVRLEVVGLDADLKTLHIAQRKLGRKRAFGMLVKGAAQSLPFHSGSLNLVTSTLIFHHLPTETKQHAIREIHRVLKEGGRFVLADFGKPASATIEVLIRLGSIFDGTENMRANLEGKLPVFLAEAGFQVSEIGEQYRGVHFLLARK